MSAAEGEKSAAFEGRADETGADHLGVDLLQFFHGLAMVQYGGQLVVLWGGLEVGGSEGI